MFYPRFHLPSTCLPAAAAAAVLKATLAKGEVDKAAEPNCGSPAAVLIYAEASGLASDPANEYQHHYYYHHHHYYYGDYVINFVIGNVLKKHIN